MADDVPFPYEGPEELGPLIAKALRQVVDPEVALSIVDIGLVYGVTVQPGWAHVRLTMTSAACPVTDVIVADVEEALERVLPAGSQIDVELCWDPPWTPDLMSETARRFMQW